MPKKMLVIERCDACSIGGTDMCRLIRIDGAWDYWCHHPKRDKNIRIPVKTKIAEGCPLPSVCECGGTIGLDGEHRECTVLVAPEESDG